MAKKDEASGTPNQGEQIGQAAEQAGQRAVRGAAEAGMHAQEAGRQTIERMASQTADWQRRSGEQAALMTDRGLRQASEMTERQGEDMSNLLSLSTRAYRDIAEYSRADVDAMVQSGACLARGWQELGWEMTHFTQNTVQLGLQLATDLMECRSVEDVVARQRDFVKETVDAVLAESARLLHLSSRMASDAVSPLSERTGSGSPEDLISQLKARQSQGGTRGREAPSAQ